MTTQLPWDRYPSPPPPPTEVPAAPSSSQPVPPAPPTPSSPPPVAIPELELRDALADALRDFWPTIKDYARQTAVAASRGQDVDHAHPTITTTTSRGQSVVVADAKNRSWRTFIQGLLIDVMFALGALVGTLSGLDPYAKQTWIILGALVIKTIIQAAISYVARLTITPTIRER